MIHLPVSKVFKEAGALSYARSVLASEYNSAEKETLAAFQKLTVSKIRVAAILALLYFFLAVASIVCSYVIHTISLLPVMDVFLLLTAIEITSVALYAQIAYIIPVHIFYYRPRDGRAFVVNELNTAVSFKKYILGFVFCVWLFSLIWYEDCTSKFQCTCWLLAAGFSTVIAIWYFIVSVKGYIAVDQAIIKKKQENEHWINEHEYD